MSCAPETTITLYVNFTWIKKSNEKDRGQSKAATEPQGGPIAWMSETQRKEK